MRHEQLLSGCLQRDIDLMYVIDGSFSVGRENFEKIKKWIKDVTNGFDVTEQVQVGVVSCDVMFSSK